MDKEFKKIKNKVLKKYPGAKCYLIDDTYVICDSAGYPIYNDTLTRLPKPTTVRQAWQYLSDTIWYSGMLIKSFNAFNDSKMFRILEKTDIEHPKKKANKKVRDDIF